ncbi:hypothetical protein [Actinomadura macra]|uniref:hypothetical protein n=1 Tax=Actinomadura macra TaxID=46164 RepID=UPI00082D6AA0|nr:hypothetical protein [Actinomadura macra]
MTIRELVYADGGEPPERRTRQAVPDPAPEIEVRGESRGFTAETVSLDHELPPDVALLCVKANARYGPRSFELYFHHRGTVRAANSGDDLDKQEAHERLSLGRLTDGLADEEWGETYRWMMNWWGRQFTLNSWIRELLESPGAQLVVFDVTSYEIPWELCYHAPPPGRPGDSGWLGQLIPVTRWTSLLFGEAEWQYGAVPQAASGGILMMESEDLRKEPDGFADFVVRSREPTVEKLLRGLADDDPAQSLFSLLMIRCHGEYTPDNRLSLNGTNLERLFEYDMTALRKAEAIVLLNACITGRPVTDTAHLAAPTRSFAQTFLSKGARAVIATAGDIGVVHSHLFAVKLVGRAGQGAQNLARLLFEHRSHYAEKVRLRPGEPDRRTVGAYKRFFWSFMYVYYGHPDTTLRLSRPEPA